jgi:putative phosphoesterase
MKKITLLSDTHGHLDERFFPHLAEADEIWHAGDIGNPEVMDRLESFAPAVAVYGNIDGLPIRGKYPEWQSWTTESVKVMMTHIGGRPPKYNPDVLPVLKQEKPQLFICGHSHILLVQYDKQLNCLHLNPGAAGKTGWHKVQTLLTFIIDGNDFREMKVVELDRRPLKT